MAELTEIVAKVTELNAADKKISLSIKALNAPEHEHKEAPKEEDVVSVYTDSDDEEIVEEVVETVAEETEETSDAE